MTSARATKERHQEVTITADTAAHDAPSAPVQRITFDADPRALLLAQRQAHLDNLDSMKAAAAQLVEGGHFLDLAGDDGFGEADGSGFELDRIRGLIAAARKGLSDVDAALARLEKSRYGICMECQAPIPPARLEAVPEATHCVACKTAGIRRRR